MSSADTTTLSVSAAHRLRMLIAPVRSGTTAFLHTVAQNPEILTLSFVMKDTLDQDGQTNYSVYTDLEFDRFLLYKASFGYQTLAHCRYMPFRSRNDILCVRPIFLFREPVQTFNSWFKKGWTDKYLFVAAYTHAYDLMTLCKRLEAPVRAMTYEHLAMNPLISFSTTFAFWGLPFNPDVLNWTTTVGESTLKLKGKLGSEIKARMKRGVEGGVYDSIRQGTQQFEYRKRDVVIDSSDREYIEQHLGPLYRDLERQSAAFLGLTDQHE